MVGLLQNLYRASSDKVFQKLTQLYYFERRQDKGVLPVTYRGDAQQLLRRSEKEVGFPFLELFFIDLVKGFAVRTSAPTSTVNTTIYLSTTATTSPRLGSFGCLKYFEI